MGFGGPEAMPGGMNSREGIYGVSVGLHILSEDVDDIGLLNYESD